MKRIVSVIILLSVMSLAFCANGYIWYQNTTEDALNVFDLSSVYYLPMRSATWGSDSASTGTMNSSNYIGQLGIKSCSHKIRFTVTTDGKFVSQSDPTKYREFCIAMGPRYEYSGSDYQFAYNAEGNGSKVNNSDRMPNTKTTGTAYIVAPLTNNTNTYVSSTTRRRIQRFWIDLVLCMDSLDTEAMKHMAENNDYIATVTLSWSCETTSCTDATHSGTYNFILRGYFGSQSSEDSQDAVYMFVVPSVTASNMSIKGVIQGSVSNKIADIQIHTNTRTDTSTNVVGSGSCPGYEWKDHVFAFISASNNYLTSNQEGFQLIRNKSLGNVSIPYTLVVQNVDGSTNRVFDGTASYTGSTATEKRAYCIDLGDYSTSTDRYGNTYNTINWYGVVNINIDDPQGDIVNNTNGVYSGLYESIIYYHIIYE